MVVWTTWDGYFSNFPEKNKKDFGTIDNKRDIMKPYCQVYSPVYIVTLLVIINEAFRFKVLKKALAYLAKYKNRQPRERN